MPDESLSDDYLKKLYKDLQATYQHLNAVVALAKAHKVPHVAVPVVDLDLIAAILSHCGAVVKAQLTNSEQINAEVQSSYHDLLTRIRKKMDGDHG